VRLEARGRDDLVAEDVEQAAVDHVVELLCPALQRQGVHDQEAGRQTSLACLAPRPVDRLFEEVDARDLAAPAGEEQGVLTRAVAGVEDGAGDLVGLPELREICDKSLAFRGQRRILMSWRVKSED
jgi:hypothetical protein